MDSYMYFLRKSNRRPFVSDVFDEDPDDADLGLLGALNLPVYEPARDPISVQMRKAAYGAAGSRAGNCATESGAAAAAAGTSELAEQPAAVRSRFAQRTAAPRMKRTIDIFLPTLLEEDEDEMSGIGAALECVQPLPPPSAALSCKQQAEPQKMATTYPLSYYKPADCERQLEQEPMQRARRINTSFSRFDKMDCKVAGDNKPVLGIGNAAYPK